MCCFICAISCFFASIFVSLSVISLRLYCSAQGFLRIGVILHLGLLCLALQYVEFLLRLR